MMTRRHESGLVHLSRGWPAKRWGVSAWRRSAFAGQAVTARSPVLQRGCAGGRGDFQPVDVRQADENTFIDFSSHDELSGSVSGATV